MFYFVQHVTLKADLQLVLPVLLITAARNLPQALKACFQTVATLLLLEGIAVASCTANLRYTNRVVRELHATGRIELADQVQCKSGSIKIVLFNRITDYSKPFVLQ